MFDFVLFSYKFKLEIHWFMFLILFFCQSISNIIKHLPQKTRILRVCSRLMLYKKVGKFLFENTFFQFATYNTCHFIYYFIFFIITTNSFKIECNLLFLKYKKTLRMLWKRFELMFVSLIIKIIIIDKSNLAKCCIRNNLIILFLSDLICYIKKRYLISKYL